MFQDVDVKIQVRPYLNFDVNVLKHAFFPWIITAKEKDVSKMETQVQFFTQTLRLTPWKTPFFIRDVLASKIKMQNLY